MTTWALIANKFAGTRSTKNFWKKIDEKFTKVGITVEYFFTERGDLYEESTFNTIKHNNVYIGFQFLYNSLCSRYRFCRIHTNFTICFLIVI